MKKILAIVSKFFLVTLFGIPQACIQTTMCEYGCPTVDYQLKGTVMDEDMNPIEGIKVSIEDSRNGHVADDMTDVSGEFVFNETIAGFSIDEVRVFFRDIDGSDGGGEFAPDSLKVSVHKVAEGDGNWHRGTFESDDVEIYLKKK